MTAIRVRVLRRSKPSWSLSVQKIDSTHCGIGARWGPGAPQIDSGAEHRDEQEVESASIVASSGSAVTT
jgi:hypothetical protein